VRVSPYRALEQQVVGAALVFSVIERRKRSLDPASELVAHASTYLRGLRCPLLLVDSQKCVVWVNDSFCELFRVHMADAVGKPLTKLGARQWFDRTLLAAIEGTLSTGRPFRGHRVWLEVPEKGARTLEASGGRLPAPEGDSTLVLLSLRNARPSEPRVTGPRSPGLV
jgi:PAS domain-containing protein